VYRLSGAVGFMFLALFGLATAISGRRLTRRGFPPRVPGFPTVLFSLLAIAAIADLVAALQLFGQRAAFAYVGSLVVMLLAAVAALCVFLVLLARKTKRD
jgi:ammonia channel protein AmtB